MKRTGDDNRRGFLAGRCSSFRAAFQGLFFVVRTEVNLQIHLAAMLAVVSAGLYFELSVTEWCAIILATGGVLVTEVLNTAIERLMDHLTPDFSELAGRIKDIAAAAVLISAVTASVVGFLTFGPRFFDLISAAF